MRAPTRSSWPPGRRKIPAYNVGHSPDDSGHFVLDVDPRHNGDKTLESLIAEHGPLPKTYTVRTPSGGLHYWFRGTAPSSAGRLGEGLDVRGRGGYVLVEGSRVNGAEYVAVDDAAAVDAPEWVLQLANTPTRAVVSAVAEIELDTAANVERAAAFLKAQPPAVEGQGGDAQTYATAATLHDLGISEDKANDLLLLHWNDRCEPPWEWDELAEKVRNAYAYAQNGAGVYAITTTAQETFGSAIAALPTTATITAPTNPRPLRAGELASGSFPRPSYVLDKFLLAGLVNLLYGDGGT